MSHQKNCVSETLSNFEPQILQVHRLVLSRPPATYQSPLQDDGSGHWGAAAPHPLPHSTTPSALCNAPSRLRPKTRSPLPDTRTGPPSCEPVQVIDDGQVQWRRHSLTDVLRIGLQSRTQGHRPSSLACPLSAPRTRARGRGEGRGGTEVPHSGWCAAKPPPYPQPHRAPAAHNQVAPQHRRRRWGDGTIESLVSIRLTRPRRRAPCGSAARAGHWLRLRSTSRRVDLTLTAHLAAQGEPGGRRPG